MFLFIKISFRSLTDYSLFKYISCSYLSLNCSVSSYSSSHLNTSHVLIYRNLFIYLVLILCNLNTSHVLIYPSTVHTWGTYNTFKYISCSYLSSLIFLEKRVLLHLNTSHVLIYRTTRVRKKSLKAYLNTSHVLIYQELQQILCMSLTNLNTSHVLIYHHPCKIQQDFLRI